MRTYVKFYEPKLSGLEGEALGTDSVYFLDGRNSLAVMVEDAKDRLHTLRFVKPWYSSWEIRRGNFTNYEVIFKSEGILI